MSENNELEVLRAENEELKSLLKYYYGAEELLDNATDILDKAIDAEGVLEEKAAEIDAYVFEKETELQNREIKLEAKEKKAETILAEATSKKQNINKAIAQKAEELNAEYRKKNATLLMVITAVYTVLAIVLYLYMK